MASKYDSWHKSCLENVRAPFNAKLQESAGKQEKVFNILHVLEMRWSNKMLTW